MNIAVLELSAYELVDGIPKGKNKLTCNSLIYTIRAAFTVVNTEPVGPTKLIMYSENDAVTGNALVASVVVALRAYELLNGIPSGKNWILINITVECYKFLVCQLKPFLCIELLSTNTHLYPEILILGILPNLPLTH